MTPRLEARIRSDFAADEADLVLDELDTLALPLIDGPAPEHLIVTLQALNNRLVESGLLSPKAMGKREWPRPARFRPTAT